MEADSKRINMTLQHRPISINYANAFIGVEHRHCGEVPGGKFALGAFDGDRLCGVVIVGRTTARALHDPLRCQVTRLATDGTWNSCSFLYARARRVAQVMGYVSCKTYDRADESGASMRAIGACCEAELEARSWEKSSKSRPRTDKSEPAPRRRYELITTPTRPVLRYHGGKWRIAPWIIEQFPKHRVYVEPFGGGGSVLMRKERSDFEVYNDLDSDVNVFRVLRDRQAAAELRRLLELTPWAREEFEGSYIPSIDPVEQARRTIVRCFMAHGSTSRRRGRTGFRAASHPGRRGGGFGDWRGYHDALEAFTDRLHGVVIECRDAFYIIQRHDAPDALFYVDPPYVVDTRSSVRCDGDTDRAYAHDLTDDDHRRLAIALHRCSAAVVVSGYPCKLYDEELYVGWTRRERRSRADGGRARTEVTWSKPAGLCLPAPATFGQASLELEALA